LNKAIAAKLPANEMVKTIFIFSNKEFDCCGGKEYETKYMLIQRKFAEAGYPLPGNLMFLLQDLKQMLISFNFRHRLLELAWWRPLQTGHEATKECDHGLWILRPNVAHVPREWQIQFAVRDNVGYLGQTL